MARNRRDRISRLPDELLLHILSFLPTKYAVSTSLLSKRWSDLLIYLPSFDFQLVSHLHCRRSRRILVNSVDNLITVNTCPTISKFRFHVPDFRRKYLSQLNGWLRTLLSRNLIELDLNIFFSRWSTKCLRLLPCESLQILKLRTNVGLDVPISRGCFPNLRIFHLRYEGTPGRPFCEELFANLFPNLPLLEELSIQALLCSSVREVTFNIIAPALKIFSFYEHHVDEDCSGVKIVLDAPLLEKIRLSHYNIASYSFKTLPSFSVAKVSVGKSLMVDGCLVNHSYVAEYSYTPEYIVKTMDLLWGVSNAKSISLTKTSVLALVISRQKDMPAFPFLTELKLVIPSACAWKLLLPLIANSPNLEVLILKVTEFYNADGYIEDETMLAVLVGEFKFVPPKNIPACLLVHLKEIEVKGVKKIEEFEVLEYIVKNAKVLNKLTVSEDV